MLSSESQRSQEACLDNVGDFYFYCLHTKPSRTDTFILYYLIHSSSIQTELKATVTSVYDFRITRTQTELILSKSATKRWDDIQNDSTHLKKLIVVLLHLHVTDGT